MRNAEQYWKYRKCFTCYAIQQTCNLDTVNEKAYNTQFTGEFKCKLSKRLSDYFF